MLICYGELLPPLAQPPNWEPGRLKTSGELRHECYDTWQRR